MCDEEEEEEEAAAVGLLFIASSCCSIWRFGRPERICPALPPSCDSDVVSWKHASTQSVWRIKHTHTRVHTHAHTHTPKGRVREKKPHKSPQSWQLGDFATHIIIIIIICTSPAPWMCAKHSLCSQRAAFQSNCSGADNKKTKKQNRISSSVCSSSRVAFTSAFRVFQRRRILPFNQLDLPLVAQRLAEHFLSWKKLLYTF